MGWGCWVVRCCHENNQLFVCVGRADWKKGKGKGSKGPRIQTSHVTAIISLVVVIFNLGGSALVEEVDGRDI
jgi:hypothetical protein